MHLHIRPSVFSNTPSTLPAPEPTTSPAPGAFRLAIKDNIATLPHDGPTTCASAILAGHTSPYEATIVTQLKARGAVLVGKTNLDEFGMGSHSIHSAHGAVAQEVPDRSRPGQTIQVSAGGSSGGSALAVATGQADVALGTDTGGSVRLPAAYCGVVGYKPSYGMLSRYGVVPYANSLDTVGILAKTARQIQQLVVGLCAEGDALDPTSVPSESRARFARDRECYNNDVASVKEELPRRAKELLRPLTFGIPVEYNIAELDAPLRQAWADVAAFLQSSAVGAWVVPVSLPSTRHALSAYYVIAPAEASSNLAKYDGVRYGPKQHEIESRKNSDDIPQGQQVLYSRVRGAGFGAEVQRRILLGAYSLSAEAMDNHFLQAQRVRRLVRRDFDRVFALSNPLVGPEEQHFNLADMDEAVLLENKLGPAQVDFLLCPTAPTLAPRLAEVEKSVAESPVEAYVNDVFTVPASLAGLPAVSVPWRVEGGGGAVMGLQVIGQYWDDARMLAVADALGVLEGEAWEALRRR